MKSAQQRRTRTAGSATQQASAEPGERKLAAQVEREQVNALYGKGALALVANSLVGAVLLVALWGSVPAAFAVTWWTAMTALVLLRLAVWWRFPARTGGGEVPVATPALWARRWVAGTALTGALWGSAALWLFPAEPSGQVILVCAFAGMAAGSSTSASSYLPAFRAFVIPQLTPLVLKLASLKTPEYVSLAIMTLVFGLAMDRVAQHGNRVLTEAIRLRWHNSHLLEELREAQGHLLALNADLENRVAVRTEALQQVIASRDELLSLVSHELRTPLMAMKLTEASVLRMLRQLEVPDRLTVAYQRFGRQIRRLSLLVDELLDLSRLRSGRLTLNPEQVKVEELIQTAKEELMPLIDQASVDVDIHLEKDLSGCWDRQRLVQVLINLLSNALKYGEGRPVSISSGRVGDQARIAVADQGPGIASTDLEKIFEPFERAGADEGVTGTGLGLYIARRLVVAHGGRLWARPRPSGRGAEFIVELPAQPPGPPPGPGMIH